MIQSQQILEWEERGESRGELRQARKSVLAVVDARFAAAVSRKFVRQVEATEDMKQLTRWLIQAATSQDWDEFSKGWNESHGK